MNIRAEVEPVEEEQHAQHGEPQWMKVFKIESELDLTPDDLVRMLLGGPDSILPDETEIETEWKLIQSKPGDAEGEEEDADVKEDPLDDGKHSVVRRYEFYRYTGPRDPENNEALPCIDDDMPVPPDEPVEGCSDLGEFVGAQNVAVDVDLPITENALPTGEVGLQYASVALLVAGCADRNREPDPDAYSHRHHHASASPTPVACAGDCSANGEVTIDELITLVNIALGSLPHTACAALAPATPVTIAYRVRSVGNSLDGCG